MQGNYGQTKKKIVEKMAPQSFISLDDFHKRRLHTGEPISVYVHELKKLLSQAMPELDATARDQLLMHQFLTGVPSDVSKPIRAASEVTSLDQAIEKARLLMAVDGKDPTPVAAVNEGATANQLQELQGQISALTEQVAMLSTRKQRPNQPALRCHSCGGMGHLQRECPTQRRATEGRCCFYCKKWGHIQRNCPEQHQGNDYGATAPGSSRQRQS